MQQLHQPALMSMGVHTKMGGDLTSRGRPKGIWNLGRYFLVNDRNFVEAKDVDLEALASELGALKPSERLAVTSV